MRRLVTTTLALVALSGCGDSPTAPGDQPAATGVPFDPQVDPALAAAIVDAAAARGIPVARVREGFAAVTRAGQRGSQADALGALAAVRSALAEAPWQEEPLLRAGLELMLAAAESALDDPRATDPSHD